MEAGTYAAAENRPTISGEKGLLLTSAVSNGRFDPSEHKAVADPHEAARLVEPVRAGSILVSRINTTDLVGANALVDEDHPGLFLPDRLWALTVRDGEDVRWLAQLLASPAVRAALGDRSAGTSGSMKYLTRDAVLDLPLRRALPDEQCKIAAFLSAVDARIAAAGRERAGLGRFKAGLLQALFSRTLRFARDDGRAFPEWEERTLGLLASIEKGEQLNRDTLSASGPYPVINGGVTPSGYTDQFNREGMTITVSEGGNSCGYVALQPERFWSGGHCFTIAPLNGDVLNDFLYQSLKHSEPDLMRLRVGSGLPNVQKNALSAWRLLLPHPNEQAKIAAALTTLDRRLDLAAGEETALRRFKAGLLQAMFV